MLLLISLLNVPTYISAKNNKVIVIKYAKIIPKDDITIFKRTLMTKQKN